MLIKYIYEKLQEIALIENINDIIKFRDPVLEKMEYSKHSHNQI